MTKIQHMFLKFLSQEDLTSKELCQLLKLRTDPNDIGCFYNAVNKSINYLTVDAPCDIENYFKISFDSTYTPLGKEIYSITDAGRDYLVSHKKQKHQIFIEITTIVLALISAISAIIALF